MSTKTKKNRPDLGSIRTITLIYFIAFAAILILMIWFLQNFFVNNYYERMKSQETRAAALSLEQDYRTDKKLFIQKAHQVSMNNGVFIRIDDIEGILIFDGGTLIESNSSMFDEEIDNARAALESSELGSISFKTPESGSVSRLVFATRIEDGMYPAELFIVAPLYPVQSTISILRRQLMYISIISLLVAALLAIFMANRLSSPIEGLTKSAMELSRGNYNVKFNGEGFTEIEELAGTLNTASYEMQKTEFYQRDLIANVSHDLKTPLTMIKSYAEMINDISGDDPAKRTEHLHVIIQEADRLNKLVSDMLSVSRLQSNTAELDKRKFNIVQAAEDVLETFEILNEHDNYNIMPKLCKATYVYGDEDRIKQVMTNLISNAVKYCGEDKFVKVELKRAGNKKVRFDVVDHGEGIASDELTHVWDRYYRTSANHDREIEGTGLGLSIVKGILTLHNANYGVESKEGEGSDFWFEMDIVKKND